MSVKKPQAGFPENFIPNEEEIAKINEIRKWIGPAANNFACEFSDASILRFLRARNYNTRRAAKKMKETMKWRHKYKPEMIRWDDTSHEAKAGKLYRANYFDKYGRTVLVMRPERKLCGRSNQVLGVLFGGAISSLHEGQEQMVWLIDFRRWNMSSISVKVTHETARVLQDHYPERLGVVIVYNPLKMVKPFLEPKTYNKMRFVYSDQPQTMKVMEALFDMEKLEEFEAYAKRVKDEEENRKHQASNTTELQDSDFLMSNVSSEANSSSNYEVGSDSEVKSRESMHEVIV